VEDTKKVAEELKEEIPKRSEKGVKIAIGEKQAEVDKPEDGEDSYNPYLYDTSGPKR
jgi:hypothetical protein